MKRIYQWLRDRFRPQWTYWVGHCICRACEHEWVGLVPIRDNNPPARLECPRCGNKTSGKAIATGGPIRLTHRPPYVGE